MQPNLTHSCVWSDIVHGSWKLDSIRKQWANLEIQEILKLKARGLSLNPIVYGGESIP